MALLGQWEAREFLATAAGKISRAVGVVKPLAGSTRAPSSINCLPTATRPCASTAGRCWHDRRSGDAGPHTGQWRTPSCITARTALSSGGGRCERLYLWCDRRHRLHPRCAVPGRW
jgi:hypothetical protein